MGIVYEGRDPNLDRRVAIKTVKVENMSEEAAAEYEARFRTEARSAARLQHPNIVSVYDSDRDGDIAFLVMEYIQGDDLKHHIDKGERYTLDQSLKMIRDLLAALDYAHKQGIVHRDIKPANLLIEPGGRIKLTDFGVARIQDSGEATRTQGAMVGTLKYMSPEQVQGQPVDSRADLFSVGIVLYQLLTDKRPFDGENDFSIIHQIIGHSPTPPSVINPQLPAAIDAVVARALAKKRDERFATARDFAVALQAAIRRASDQTIVPPANPGKQAGAGETRGSGVTMGSATSGTSSTSATSSTSTNTSTVTQELELVYWKDIKDSVEPEEIEGFLVKFPTGIYADLARRRLKKLASGASMDATMGSYGTQVPAGNQDTDATRMRTDFSRPAAPDGVTSPGSSSGTGGRSGDYTRTMIQPRGDDSTSSPPVSGQVSAPAVAAEAAPPPVDPRDAPTIPPLPAKPVPQPAAPPPAVAAGASASAPAAAGKSRTTMFAIVGIAGLALAGVALKFMMGSGGAPAADAAASAAALTASAASSPALPVSAAVAAAVAASSPASAAQAGSSRPAASAPRLTASQLAARAKPKASVPASAPVIAPVAPAPQAPAPVQRAETRPASAPAAAPAPVAAADPKDGCEGRLLLGYQICLSEQCAKPAFRSHPTCVERREMERRQREQQNRIIN